MPILVSCCILQSQVFPCFVFKNQRWKRKAKCMCVLRMSFSEVPQTHSCFYFHKHFRKSYPMTLLYINTLTISLIVPRSEDKICWLLLLLVFVGEEWFLEALWSTVEHQRQILSSCMEIHRHRNNCTWSAMLLHSYCTAQSRKDFWFGFSSVVD